MGSTIPSAPVRWSMSRPESSTRSARTAAARWRASVALARATSRASARQVCSTHDVQDGVSVSRELTIGIAQITARGDATESRELSVAAAAKLLDDGAQMVILPELIVPGYRLDAEFLRAGS